MTCPALGSIVLCQFLQLSPNDCKVIYVRLAMNSVGHTKIQIYNIVFKSFLTHVYIDIQIYNENSKRCFSLEVYNKIYK